MTPSTAVNNKWINKKKHTMGNNAPPKKGTISMSTQATAHDIVARGVKFVEPCI